MCTKIQLHTFPYSRTEYHISLNKLLVLKTACAPSPDPLLNSDKVIQSKFQYDGARLAGSLASSRSPLHHSAACPGFYGRRQGRIYAQLIAWTQTVVGMRQATSRPAIRIDKTCSTHRQYIRSLYLKRFRRLDQAYAITYAMLVVRIGAQTAAATAVRDCYSLERAGVQQKPLHVAPL